MFFNEFVKITSKVWRPGEGARGKIEKHLEHPCFKLSNFLIFSQRRQGVQVFHKLICSKNASGPCQDTLSWPGLALTVSPGIDQSEASWGESQPIGGLVESGSGSGRERVLVTWLQSQSDVGRDRAETAPSEISRQEWNMRITRIVTNTTYAVTMSSGLRQCCGS